MGCDTSGKVDGVIREGKRRLIKMMVYGILEGS